VVHQDHVVMVAGPVQGREVSVRCPFGMVHSAAAPWAGSPGRARPDTGALWGRCSLSAWPGDRHPGRRSLPDPLGVWAGEPCPGRGQWLTAGTFARGGVIHQLGRDGLHGPPPSLVINSGSGIRAGVRGKGAPVAPQPQRPRTLPPHWASLYRYIISADALADVDHQSRGVVPAVRARRLDVHDWSWAGYGALRRLRSAPAVAGPAGRGS
jgi:hypothetical protein